MRQNLSSALKTRWRASSMSDFDALPPEARAWLREAALPWSVTSVKRIWFKAGSPDRALERLSRVEHATIQRLPDPIAGPRPGADLVSSRLRTGRRDADNSALRRN